jgi:uncharacterized cupredoxin-like copper-binding protein
MPEVKRLLFSCIASVALIATACGGGHSASHSSKAVDSHAAHHTGSIEGDTMGVPADAGDADRTIKISMLDDFAYSPARLKLSRGDVVTFEIVNKGTLMHEFVLGDKDYQVMHEEQVADGGHHTQMRNGLSLGPGASGALTWRFTESGEVLYGCHEPGHYSAGMVGKVSVG